MKLENCAPEFRRRMAAIAAIAGKPVEEVFALWREYSAACSAADQSAIVWEFVEWYAPKLGGDVNALREVA